MPRSEELVLRLVELTLRIERMRAALDGSLNRLLTPEEREGLEAALAAAEGEKRQLEEQLRGAGGAGS